MPQQRGQTKFTHEQLETMWKEATSGNHPYAGSRSATKTRLNFNMDEMVDFALTELSITISKPHLIEIFIKRSPNWATSPPPEDERNYIMEQIVANPNITAKAMCKMLSTQDFTNAPRSNESARQAMRSIKKEIAAKKRNDTRAANFVQNNQVKINKSTQNKNTINAIKILKKMAVQSKGKSTSSSSSSSSNKNKKVVGKKRKERESSSSLSSSSSSSSSSSNQKKSSSNKKKKGNILKKKKKKKKKKSFASYIMKPNDQHG